MPSGKRQVKNIYLHLTRQCNLHCDYCYFDAAACEDGEMSLSHLERLFGDIVMLAPQKVTFTGGEALLRKDLFAIARLFKELAGETKLCLASNGTLIDEPCARDISALFDEVRISIDGPGEINDVLRGPGTFEATARAIRLLSLAGAPPAAAITVTSSNIETLPRFLTYLKEELFIADFHLSLFRPVGRGGARRDLEVSWRDVQQKISEYWGENFGSLKNMPSGSVKLCAGCGVGQYINILPDGSVYPCHVLTQPAFNMGNVRDKSLIEIYNNSPVLDRLEAMDIKGGELVYDRLNIVCLGEALHQYPQLFTA